MRALVFFALESEARPFRRWAAGQPDCQIAVTGMGRIQAVRSAEKILRPGVSDLVLTCGFAGALNPVLRCGQIVLDADPAFPLIDKMSKTGGIPGRFLLVPEVIVTAADKTALWNSSGADAVDMESAAIRDICRQRGLPGATVRVISDTARQDLPLDFSRLMDPAGRIRYPQLTLALVQSPRRIAGLLQFGRQLRHCSRNLADFLAAVLIGDGSRRANLPLMPGALGP